MEVVVKNDKYIYCIIRPASGGQKTFGPLGIGGREDELHVVCLNDIAAVVSNSPLKKYPVCRENMLAHEKAIEEVMKEYTVLPVRFGVIAENDDKIKKILEKEYDKFKDLLNKMDNKKELGLKAIVNEEIYQDILEKYEDIKRLKEKLATLPPEKTYYQRTKIGEMVEGALKKERENYKAAILNVLSPLAQEVKMNNSYWELMIINAAFLVEKSREIEFDRQVEELVKKYDHRVKFKYVGTIPPFNFVNLVINTEDY